MGVTTRCPFLLLVLNSFKAVLGATVVVAFSTPSYAHEMYRNADSFVTYDSTVEFVMRNAYAKAAFFDLQLFTKDMVEVASDEWYVDDEYLERFNEVYLQAGDDMVFVVHVKNLGKYYFCSSLEEYEDGTKTNVRSRICSRISRK